MGWNVMNIDDSGTGETNEDIVHAADDEAMVFK
jgi:hypothetical protein